ncbi:unnamed protein product [Heterosigma akashiwo]
MDINYPGNAADIPFHSRFRHFEAGGIDRVEQVINHTRANNIHLTNNRVLRCRRLIDLAVTSVLLDAGAGDAWKYTEAAAAAEGGEGFVGGRSEGLGVASFHMFCAGAFSSDPEGHPHRADAEGLQALTPAKVAEAFQVDAAANPLVGRWAPGLLRRAGGPPEYFHGRPVPPGAPVRLPPGRAGPRQQAGHPRPVGGGHVTGSRLCGPRRGGSWWGDQHGRRVAAQRAAARARGGRGGGGGAGRPSPLPQTEPVDDILPNGASPKDCWLEYREPRGNDWAARVPQRGAAGGYGRLGAEGGGDPREGPRPGRGGHH